MDKGEFDIKKESEFIQACHSGDLKEVTSEVTLNPSVVNTPASNGSLPLMFAAEAGHTAIVSYLLEKKRVLMTFLKPVLIKD